MANLYSHTRNTVDAKDFNGALFSLGHVCMTCGINHEINEKPDFAKEIAGSLLRHMRGDFADMESEDDKQLNAEAIRTGDDRVFSAYNTTSGKIWIITEWDRSYTTVLFPDEY